MNAEDKIKSTRNYYMERWSAADALLREAQAEVARLRAALEKARVQVDCIAHYSDEVEVCVLAAKALEAIDAAMEPSR